MYGHWSYRFLWNRFITFYIISWHYVLPIHKYVIIPTNNAIIGTYNIINNIYILYLGT